MELSNSEIILVILFLTTFIVVATIVYAFLDWKRESQTMLEKAPYVIPTTGVNTLSIYDTPTYKRQGLRLPFTRSGIGNSLTVA